MLSKQQTVLQKLSLHRDKKWKIVHGAGVAYYKKKKKRISKNETVDLGEKLDMRLAVFQDRHLQYYCFSSKHTGIPRFLYISFNLSKLYTWCSTGYT